MSSPRFASLRIVTLAALGVMLATGCAPASNDDSAAGPAGRPLQAPDDGEVRTPPILQDFDIGGDFALPAYDGTAFDLAEHRGEVFLMFFGYTHCPDFCPATLSLLAQVYERLGEQAEDVTTLMISIDPERDTPETLAQYLGYFSVPAIGMVAPPAELAPVVRAYGGMVERGEVVGDNQLFGHTTYIYLIDHEGRVRYLFRPNDTPQFIAAGVAEQVEISRAAAAETGSAEGS